MSTKVGKKGQVVIEKGIRDALGVVQGSLAVQRLVGDTVELRFLPAPHHRSLKGALAAYVVEPLSESALREAEQAAWSSEAVRADKEASHRDG